MEILFWMVYITLVVFMMACMWIIFTKAGAYGWLCLIPIYNIMILCDVANRSRWWTLLYFIPLLDLVAYIVVYFSLAKSFGRGDGFAVGLVLLPIVFLPILAFGDSQYGMRREPAVAVQPSYASGVISPQQGVAPAGSSLQQPPQVKCPFCHSTKFHVEEQAGLRRCSECQSVLPSYIQGNRQPAE